MSAQAVGQQTSKDSKPVVIQRLRLTGAHFAESVTFAGSEETSVAVGLKVDRIVPARLEATGAAVPISDNQRADGILLLRQKHDTISGRMVEYRAFVFAANVKCLVYGE